MSLFLGCGWPISNHISFILKTLYHQYQYIRANFIHLFKATVSVKNICDTAPMVSGIHCGLCCLYTSEHTTAESVKLNNPIKFYHRSENQFRKCGAETRIANTNKKVRRNKISNTYSLRKWGCLGLFNCFCTTSCWVFVGYAGVVIGSLGYTSHITQIYVLCMCVAI